MNSSCYCQGVMSLEAEGDTLEGGGSHVNLRSSRGWSPTSHTEQTQLLPLNSWRLSLAWMQQLADGLGVNTKATLADLRLLIEGKVEQLDHEPRNVQVKVQQMSEGAHLSLQDVQGEFLHVEPPEKVVVEDSEEQSSSSGSEDLHQVVKSVQEDNAELWSRTEDLVSWTS